MSDFENRRELFTQSIIDTSLGTNAQKLYYVFTNQLDELKTNYDLLDDLLDIDYCTSNLLDNLAKLVGTSRLNGETDEKLREKIRATTLAKNSIGSAKDITSIVKAFDDVNTYTLTENPTSDTLYFDGKTTLDGYEFFGTMYPATFFLARFVDDVDTVDYTLSDFISSAKSAGVNGAYALFVDITGAIHYYEPFNIWDGLSTLDGNTIMTTSKYNQERWDGTETLDGNGYFTQAIGYYYVDKYKILDYLDEVVKEEVFKPRFIDGVFTYSALLRESEGNGKFIKKIQFLHGSTINFEVTLPDSILKKDYIRLLFYEKNL